MAVDADCPTSIPAIAALLCEGHFERRELHQEHNPNGPILESVALSDE
jgi:hypothetical protein